MHSGQHHHTPGDEELIARYRAGDRDALGTLFSRYSALVYGVCLKYLKDREESRDAVLQIFEKLMTDLHRVHIETFRPWLHTVARNHCLMFLRKKHPERLGEFQERQLADTDSGAFDVEKEERLNLLEEAIQELSAPQQDCIRKFYLQGQSYQQVCDSTGFSMNEVKSHLQNGRRNIKIRMLQKQREFPTQNQP
jgi:RNA polymerase sigma-70 factor (ECF subfamily)